MSDLVPNVSYATFALGLSWIVVIQYVLLLAIAIRRARFRDRRAIPRQEQVTTHARYLEGPMLTVLFLVALGTFIAATYIGREDYVRAAGFVVAVARGALFVLGAWTLAWYWHQRVTWLP